MTRHSLQMGRRTRVAAAALAAFAAASAATAADPASAGAAKLRELQLQNAALAKSVADLQEQMQDMARQLQALQQQSGTLADQQQQQAQQAQKQAVQSTADQQQLRNDVTAATQTASDAAQQATVQAARFEPWRRISLWGYGEVYYTHPTHDAAQTQFDLARAVFGIGYQFDDLTRFNSEYEVEHGVASADDAGEFEVEQFYVDRKLSDKVSARAGLFLIPAGLLNENHEPTNFFGVQRNFVETLIIPSTWREGGLSFYGTTEAGFDWNVGLTSGVNLSKWDFAPEYAPYTTALELEDNDVAPLQATHQELALANGQHPSAFLSLNYRGVPGLTLGGTYFGGGAVPAQPGIGSQRVGLWETHARWQPGNWDLSALYASGSISNTGAANRLFPGTANPMPSKFDGWFAQAAYNLWQSGSYRLAPFGRYEHYDMGAHYAGIAPGFGSSPSGQVPNSTAPTSLDYFPVPRDRVATVGANLYLNPDVVLKLDYQRFKLNTDFNRIDLGLGLQF